MSVPSRCGEQHNSSRTFECQLLATSAPAGHMTPTLNCIQPDRGRLQPRAIVQVTRSQGSRRSPAYLDDGLPGLVTSQLGALRRPDGSHGLALSRHGEDGAVGLSQWTTHVDSRSSLKPCILKFHAYRGFALPVNTSATDQALKPLRGTVF